MAIVLVSRVRALREGLCAQLVASGHKRPVLVSDMERASWVGLSETPRVLFVSSEAGEGIRFVEEFRSMHSSTSVGVLAVNNTDGEFLSWARAGISGYVEPDASVDDIVSTIARLADGEIVYPARLSALLLHHFSNRSATAADFESVKGLTRRELEVIKLLADGRANKQIARALVITNATVKNHVHSILEKLDVRSRGEAAAYFHRLAGLPKAANAMSAPGLTRRHGEVSIGARVSR